MAKTSAGNHNINTKEIKSIPIAVPPMAEQKEISNVLAELDKKIETERNRQEESSLLKTGLMQKLLTGELRVKV